MCSFRWYNHKISITLLWTFITVAYVGCRLTCCCCIQVWRLICAYMLVCLYVCIMYMCVYVHMSRSLETCRRRRVRIPRQRRSGDHIKWEEMSGAYGTWYMWGRRCIWHMVHVGETVHMAHGTCGGGGAYGTWYMWGRRCIWHMVHVGETRNV